MSAFRDLECSRAVSFDDAGICMDRRSDLEVADARHRYAKNLRLYNEYWKRLSPNTNHINSDFFLWLDSPSFVELPQCPRSVLDSDVVRYCDRTERLQYVFDIDSDGRFLSHESGVALTTNEEGYIFVIKDNSLYAAEKITKSSPRLHHSSFVAGEPVQAAGVMICADGALKKLFAHSGHYRPTEYNILQLLHFLLGANVRLVDVEVDAQRICKINRVDSSGNKSKKRDTTVMWKALDMLDFLEHKYSFSLVFHQLIETRAVHKRALDSQANAVTDTVMEHLIGHRAAPTLSISAPSVGSVIEEEQTLTPYCRNDET